MPDMRDYIAMYLASGRGGMPGGGAPVPSNLQGYQQLPSGQFMPGSEEPGGNWPAGPGGNWPMPPVGPGTGPPMPGDQGQRPGFPTIPNEGVGYEGLGGTGPTTGPLPTPPVDTPMQGPQQPWEPQGPLPPAPPLVQNPNYGQTVGGMDPQQWLRMYREPALGPTGGG